MGDAVTCLICENEIDGDDLSPGDDGVTESDLRSECEICGLTFAKAWAAATGKSEESILAHYDEIRAAFGSG